MSLLWTPTVIVYDLSLVLLTGQVDAGYLARMADSLRVPQQVAWAVAWKESRDGRKENNYLGQGRLVERRVSGDSVVVYRICRELGRFQINPCTWRSSDPQCSLAKIRSSYESNVYCGLMWLRRLRDVHGDWGLAIERYNGRGTLARAYRHDAESYIGRLQLRLL